MFYIDTNRIHSSKNFIINCPAPSSLHIYPIPCEDVKLKAADIIIAGEVNGGFERHGFQWGTNRVDLTQCLPEYLPRDNRSGEVKNSHVSFIGTGFILF